MKRRLFHRSNRNAFAKAGGIWIREAMLPVQESDDVKVIDSNPRVTEVGKSCPILPLFSGFSLLIFNTTNFAFLWEDL
jgi:hypothetical protein